MSIPNAKTIKTNLNPDYMKAFEKKSPRAAICELIWNALDADATEVEVKLVRNELGSIFEAGGIYEIEVVDNGHGIHHDQVEAHFGQLGFSAKKANPKSPGGRTMNGSKGQGRYTTYCLSSALYWRTTYRAQDQQVYAYEIKGSRDGSFTIGSPKPVDESTGTCFRCDIAQNLPLDYEAMESVLLPTFALFLMNHRDVKLIYDGRTIDPNQFIERGTDEEFEGHSVRGVVDASLKIVEWRKEMDRNIYLCDSNGTVYYEAKLQVHTKGMKPSFYVFSTQLREQLTQTSDELSDLDPVLQSVLEAVRSRAKRYYRASQAELRRKKIADWQQAGIYPTWQGTSEGEKATRSVFDLLALQIEEKLPKFKSADTETKKLMFRLLQALVEVGDNHLSKILREVLKLNQEEQETFSKLLERTTLSSLIHANSIVVNRLQFLRDLSKLVADPELRQSVKERAHLHKILMRESWFFGEEFNLLASDKGLNEVLKQYCNFVGDPAPTEGSENPDIIDLFFGGKTPGVGPGQEHHFLVVELKRPKKSIGPDELEQLRRYARGIRSDVRFKSIPARWTFLAVSTQITESISMEVYGDDGPPGRVHHKNRDGITEEIWCKTWPQMIHENETRYRLFKESLDVEIGEQYDYLRETHADFLPDDFPTIEMPSPITVEADALASE